MQVLQQHAHRPAADHRHLLAVHFPRRTGPTSRPRPHPRHLLATIWGAGYARNIEYVRIVVRNLRQKLEEDPARPALIANEPGVGYRLRGAEG